jgi:RimJ/RimL family protein N-acetyltransferase
MITTRLLSVYEYRRYADWLKKLDTETRATYFGVPHSNETIDTLVGGIVKNSKAHNFLVAEYQGKWIGCIHLAESNIDEVEFGIIVDAEHRGNGIADRMMSEAILWARNRGYHSLYMHCLSWNQPVRHLCRKHGLLMTTEYGETETKMPLSPADISTLTQEAIIRKKNVYRMLLQRTVPFFDAVYG